MYRKLLSGVLSVTTFYVLLTGCQNLQPRPLTDNSNATFHAIGDNTLHDEMRKMAAELRVLVDVNLDTSQIEPQRNQKALAALERLNTIADGLGGEGKITNYSVINDYMGAFLYDVAVAEEFARRTPPNYFPAGSLIKSCLSCHQSF